LWGEREKGYRDGKKKRKKSKRKEKRNKRRRKVRETEDSCTPCISVSKRCTTSK
jgi:hypothetical protein